MPQAATVQSSRSDLSSTLHGACHNECPDRQGSSLKKLLLSGSLEAGFAKLGQIAHRGWVNSDSARDTYAIPCTGKLSSRHRNGTTTVELP